MIIHLFIRILVGLVLCLTFFELFSYSLFLHLFIRYFFVLPFELFSCLIIYLISCSLFLLNCANSVLFFVCSLTASLISAVCILDCCCLQGPKKLKRLGVELGVANLCQS